MGDEGRVSDNYSRRTVCDAHVQSTDRAAHQKRYANFNETNVVGKLKTIRPLGRTVILTHGVKPRLLHYRSQSNPKKRTFSVSRS